MSQAAEDQDIRNQIREDHDHTFFVTAGAGTGKTTALVGRIVALVASGAVGINRLAAITFTDAAAAELRDRVRRELEDVAADPGRAEAARSRCRQAATEIDLAAIQTIHAFAASLLRTYPLEAGLPPGFRTLDSLQQDQQFHDRFRAWLFDEVTSAEQTPEQDRDALRRALLLGLTPDLLQQLARGLQESLDLIDETTTWPRRAPSAALDQAQATGEGLAALVEQVSYARNGEEDTLVKIIRRAQFPASRLRAATTEDEALIALQRFLKSKPSANAGSKSAWSSGPNGNPVPAIKATLRAAIDGATTTLDEYRQAALADVLRLLCAFLLRFERERKQQGVATFHDLLKWSRDLLRDHPDVRRNAAGWYQRIFVDEFQDTDPLQAEIVWFLCSDTSQDEQADWLAIPLQPGKLFVVGDPKQSIYRFRRADIAVFELVRERVDAEARQVSLVQNFRSVDLVVRWVNHHFGAAMVETPAVQPAYEPLFPRPQQPDGPGPGGRAGVYVVGGPLPSGSRAGDRWAQEASDAARIAGWIAGRWQVEDEAAPGGARPLEYDDVCVLIPTRTNVRRLERAFEEAGVPCRLESGSLILQTQEVRDLLACLRSIDDPSDQVALVAALRSPAYACSDVDLLRWVEAGGRFDYEGPGEGPAGPVLSALASLRRFHDRRIDVSPAALIESFVHERMLALAAFAQRRPREAWRRLRFVVDQAYAVAASGRPTLRAVLDYLDEQRSANAPDVDSPAPESDERAVRFMTVHGAKGLEFPVVILTGLGPRQPKLPSVHLIADRRTGAIAVRCGGERAGGQINGGFVTADYEAALARELEADEAERVRLLYVAGTRARDYLFLCLHREKEDCDAGRIAEVLADSPDELCRPFVLPPNDATSSTPTAPSIEPLDEHQDEIAWATRRDSLIASLTAEPRVTPSALARRLDSPAAAAEPAEAQPCAATAEATSGSTATAPAAVEPDEDEPEAGGSADGPVEQLLRTGRGGTELGRAVHAVLQHADLTDLAGLESLAARLLPRYRTDASLDEVVALARAAAQSEPVRRAVESGRYWREVPVGVKIDGTIVEGTIDLLYERADGTLSIVDYKTDRVSAADVDARAEHHAIQGGAYTLAVGQATGRAVASFEIVFAALGDCTVSFDGDALQQHVERARGLLQPAVAGR